MDDTHKCAKDTRQQGQSGQPGQLHAHGERRDLSGDHQTNEAASGAKVRLANTGPARTPEARSRAGGEDSKDDTTHDTQRCGNGGGSGAPRNGVEDPFDSRMKQNRLDFDMRADLLLEAHPELGADVAKIILSQEFDLWQWSAELSGRRASFPDSQAMNVAGFARNDKVASTSNFRAENLAVSDFLFHEGLSYDVIIKHTDSGSHRVVDDYTRPESFPRAWIGLLGKADKFKIHTSQDISNPTTADEDRLIDIPDVGAYDTTSAVYKYTIEPRTEGFQHGSHWRTVTCGGLHMYPTECYTSRDDSDWSVLRECGPVRLAVGAERGTIEIVEVKYSAAYHHPAEEVEGAPQSQYDPNRYDKHSASMPLWPSAHDRVARGVQQWLCDEEVMKPGDRTL